MASQLRVVKSLGPDFKWVITAEILPGGSLPVDIFIHLNNGDNTLGEYQGVCSLEEYQRMQTFTGAVIPKFGNKYLKSDNAKIIVNNETDADQAIVDITNSVKSLDSSINSTPSKTLVINIP
jgi:hypothetical protein